MHLLLHHCHLRGSQSYGMAISFLLNESHITANEHNSSHSNILYRKILNRLQYVKYENKDKEIK